MVYRFMSEHRDECTIREMDVSNNSSAYYRWMKKEGKEGDGVQYCAKAFREILGERCPSVRQSMRGKGSCRDNACAESFFKTLKRERETSDGTHAVWEVRGSVFMYVEAYYNRIHIHSVLDYAAPNVYNSGQVA